MFKAIKKAVFGEEQKAGIDPCFECGKKSHDNHHVVPRQAGGKATVPLCIECHRRAHSGPRDPEIRKQLQRAVVILVEEYGFSAARAGRILGVNDRTARRWVTEASRS